MRRIRRSRAISVADAAFGFIVEQLFATNDVALGRPAAGPRRLSLPPLFADVYVD
jgi:hypothetical protein